LSDEEISILEAEDSLKMRVNKAGGKYSERLIIDPRGRIELPREAGEVSLFAHEGYESPEKLMTFAQKIQERFPGFNFNFHADPEGKWIEYTVSIVEK
jgi:hypothetical protein